MPDTDIPVTKVGCIYVIVNIVNGKRYVGQTMQPIAVRWSAHKCRARKKSTTSLIHSAMREHGIGAFEIQILEENVPLAEIDRKEKYYIDLFDSADERKGYNIQAGGYTGWDRQFKNKSKTRPDGWRKKLSESHKKKFAENPEPYILRMDKIRGMRKFGPEFREKRRNFMLGKAYSKGCRFKITPEGKKILFAKVKQQNQQTTNN